MPKKVLSLNTLKKKISDLKKQGHTIAFTNGCFDILHFGHVSYLAKAKKRDRILILGLNSDISVKKIKGKNRPIINQYDRAGLLAALACVDFVVLFDEDTPLNVIKALKPDVLIKGADWKGKGIVGEDDVKAYGGRIEYITFVANRSTTNVIDKVLKVYGK
ncbi:MAG: rfaE bifunctional protein nucleotidyltransferase chain/domain [Candidatus Omnitrophota bacterium]|jgi:rfaE bifunctional protein nucleotidyltransferase chain/domain